MARWTMEQLKNLRELHADVTGPLGEGRIHIIPISRGHRREGYGARIVWESRLFKRGLIGPLAVTQDHLESLGLSPEEATRWVNQTHRAVSTLNRLYPSFVPEIESRIKELEAAIPPALSQGETEKSA